MGVQERVAHDLQPRGHRRCPHGWWAARWSLPRSGVPSSLATALTAASTATLTAASAATLTAASAATVDAAAVAGNAVATTAIPWRAESGSRLPAAATTLLL